MKDVEKLLGDLSVSRETIDRLNRFADLIKRWNTTINLVSKASIDDLWGRHIIDSLQVFRAAPATNDWVDLGSGGGFPGLIAAIVGVDEAPDTKFTLIESDNRKATFLRNAVRESGASCTVISERAEAVLPLMAGVVSARALADLSGLLQLATRHMRDDGVALFPKGESWQNEVDKARQKWRFQLDPITSITEPKAVILKIEKVSLV